MNTTKERDYMIEAYAPKFKKDPQEFGRLSEQPAYDLHSEVHVTVDPNESPESWTEFFFGWIPGFSQSDG